MLVLGVDPGTRITGFGAVARERGRFVCVTHGVIRTKSDDLLPNRLLQLHNELVGVIESTKPDAIAVEDCFYGRNARSMLKLGHVKGLVLLLAARFDIPVAEYAPRRVKMAVVGSGGASKQQVRFMIGRMIAGAAPEGDIEKLPLDLTDALAIAVCHHHAASTPIPIGSRR